MAHSICKSGQHCGQLFDDSNMQEFLVWSMDFFQGKRQRLFEDSYHQCLPEHAKIIHGHHKAGIFSPCVRTVACSVYSLHMPRFLIFGFGVFFCQAFGPCKYVSRDIVPILTKESRQHPQTYGSPFNSNSPSRRPTKVRENWISIPPPEVSKSQLLPEFSELQTPV